MGKKIFDRDYYLSQMLVATTHSDILIVTGLRKVGKSTLVKDLFLPKYIALNNIHKSQSENISSWKKENRTLEHLEKVVTLKIRDDLKHIIFLMRFK